MQQGQGLFRQEALQHQYTSLEDLEKPFQLLRITAWLPLLALGLICAAGLTWSIVGRVPETVEATGVLLYPNRVRSVENLVAGRIIEVKVARGSQVTKNQVVAVLDMPELQQQVQQAHAKLLELQRTDRSQSDLEDLRVRQEKTLRSIQERSLDGSIEDLEKLLVRQEKDSDTAIAEQRKALDRSIEENRKLNESLKTREASAQRLANSRVVTGEQLLAAQSALTENNSTLATLEVRRTDLSLRETETRQSLVTQRARLADFKVQRQQLEVRSTQLEQETTLARATRTFQVQEQDDRLNQLKKTLDEQGQIRTPYAGRVLEAALLPGQAVAAGTSLVMIDLEETSGTGTGETPTLQNLAYFPLRSGKRIEIGMVVRISPTSLQRERFGSLVGRVKRVSEYPVGSRTPAVAVGMPELGRAFLNPGGILEVEIDLEPADTPSGYRWTSTGPPQPVTAGTMTRTTVTVESRAPITYLLPILKGWLDSSTPPDAPSPESTPGTQP